MAETRRFAGRTALVTGGFRRLGLAAARALAQEGAELVLTYHSSTRRDVTAAASDLKRLGAPRVTPYKVDLGSHAALGRFTRELEKRHEQVDYLINSAANFIEKDFFDTTMADFDTTMALNVRAPLFLAQAVAPQMRSNGFGRIINIADVAAFVPFPGYLAYSVSKGALVTLTKALAKALAPEILVNAIAPGPVLLPEDFTPTDTQRAVSATLLNRSGSPEDVVATILFLLQSDYITGTTIPVEGGRLLR